MAPGLAGCADRGLENGGRRPKPGRGAACSLCRVGVFLCPGGTAVAFKVTSEKCLPAWSQGRARRPCPPGSQRFYACWMNAASLHRSPPPSHPNCSPIPPPARPCTQKPLQPCPPEALVRASPPCPVTRCHPQPTFCPRRHRESSSPVCLAGRRGSGPHGGGSRQAPSAAPGIDEQNVD